MKGAEVDGPRTEAGRAFYKAFWPLVPRLLHEADIAAIEAEARSAALAEVEEAVKGVTFEVPRDCDCHRGETRMTYEPDEHRAVVLAVIARLQEKSA